MTSSDVERASRAIRDWAIPVALGIMGIFILISYVLLIPALHRISVQAALTAEQAHVGCIRSRDLGPPILRDYTRRHVLTLEQLKRYQLLIPKSCPTK
jgi:hypothetical protein